MPPTRNGETHPSMRRLLEFAQAATANSSNPVRTYGDLGVRLDASSACISNWKTRGISKDGAIAAEREFGCSVQWIMEGTPYRRQPNLVPPPSPPDRFTDRREVSETDWSILQAVKLMIPEEKLNELRDQASRIELQVKERIASLTGLKG